MSDTYKPNGNYNDKDIKQDFAPQYDGIQDAKNAWETANKNGDRAGMDAAHAQAEAIRNSHGYSGGSDGSQNILNGWGEQKQYYDAAGESAAAAARAQAEASAGKLRAKIPSIKQEYDNISQQAYRNYMMEQKSTNAQLTKMGLAGQGFAESTVAGQSNAYMQNTNSAQLAKQNAENEINAQADNIIAGGDVAAANAKADALRNTASAYQRYLEDAQSQSNWDKNFNQNVEESNRNQQNREETNRLNKEQDDRSVALQIAKALAQYGDFSGLKALGMSQEAIDRFMAQGK